MKRTMSVVLTLVMILVCSVFASAEVSYPLDGSNEPLVILTTVESNAPNAGYANWNETEFVKTWIEKTGINAEFKEAADNAAIVLTLSAGEYPDVVMAYESYYNGGLAAMIEDELAVKLDDYAEYMPDFLSVLDLDPTYRPYVTYNDGGLYFFANLISSDNIVSHWRGMVMRQDFLDKLNREVPTTNDELYDLLVAMRDELGCDIPLMGNWWKYVLLEDGFITTEYGLVNSVGYQVDGVYHYGAYEEGYRGALGYLNKLYTEGLFDPNFQTTDEATSQASLLNGETGVHPTSCARINTIWNRAEDPDFALVGVGSMNGSDGTNAMYTQTDTRTPSRINAYVTADCKQPEMAVAFFNWLYTDEGQVISNFGPEGLCYELNDDGIPTFTEYMTANPSGLSLDQMLYVQSMGNRPCYVVNDLTLQRFAMQEQLDAMATWDKSDATKYLLPSFSVHDSDLNDELNNLWTDIKTYMGECCVKFITGEMNLDDDFDAYIGKLQEMGMDRCIEIRQLALDAYNNK